MWKVSKYKTFSVVNIKPVFLSSKLECIMSLKDITQHFEVTRQYIDSVVVSMLWCVPGATEIMISLCPWRKWSLHYQNMSKPLTLQTKQNLLSTLAVRPVTLSCEMELIQMHQYFPSFVGHLHPSVSCPQERWCIWDSGLTTAPLMWDSKPNIL